MFNEIVDSDRMLDSLTINDSNTQLCLRYNLHETFHITFLALKLYKIFNMQQILIKY